MILTLNIVQRVTVDMDEDGLEPGDSAALVDLATLETTIAVPFPPFPGLVILYGGVETVLEDVAWDHDAQRFTAWAEPVWAQTQDAAQGIVASLVEGGFVPLDNHRDKVH